MRKLVDEENQELLRVLRELLFEDVTITAREVAKRHTGLADHPSTITRNDTRMRLVGEWTREQERLRAEKVRLGAAVETSQTLAERLREAEAEVRELQQRIKVLVASHVACVRAVHARGGTAGLRKFWASYRDIEEQLVRELAMPASTNVTELHQAARPPEP